MLLANELGGSILMTLSSTFQPKSLTFRAQSEFARLTAARHLLETVVSQDRVIELLEFATQDLEDAKREEIRPRNRFKLACHAAQTCGGVLLAAYGYQLVTPAIHRCITRVEVFQVVFDRTPEARLGAAFATAMAHRTGEMTFVSGARELEITAETLRTASDIYAATCTQIGR